MTCRNTPTRSTAEVCSSIPVLVDSFPVSANASSHSEECPNSDSAALSCLPPNFCRNTCDVTMMTSSGLPFPVISHSESPRRSESRCSSAATDIATTCCDVKVTDYAPKLLPVASTETVSRGNTKTCVSLQTSPHTTLGLFRRALTTPTTRLGCTPHSPAVVGLLPFPVPMATGQQSPLFVGGCSTMQQLATSPSCLLTPLSQRTLAASPQYPSPLRLISPSVAVSTPTDFLRLKQHVTAECCYGKLQHGSAPQVGHYIAATSAPNGCGRPANSAEEVRLRPRVPDDACQPPPLLPRRDPPQRFTLCSKISDNLAGKCVSSL